MQALGQWALDSTENPIFGYYARKISNIPAIGGVSFRLSPFRGYWPVWF